VTTATGARRPERTDGYAPIRDYAAIGDGRTAALVARDGSIDWLCLPDLDSPPLFASLLDARRGGSFRLAPDEPFEAERRYQADSNVLETTFHTASGMLRVTDALTLTDTTRLAPARELARSVECLSGSVPFRWRVEPRFAFTGSRLRLARRAGRHVALCGHEAVALGAWDAGEPIVRDEAFEGERTLQAGDRALLTLAEASGEPLVLSGRDDVLRRLAATEHFWPAWARRREYEGSWRSEVLRSALALKLLVYAPSGAIAAAPTASLPEWIGGERNWDYRFTWLRDAAYTVGAFLRLGCPAEATSFFWWAAQASARHRPELRVLYCLDGGADADEIELADLEGYRGSRPVRAGNAASRQRQLDVYGAMLDAAWLYACETGGIDGESGRSLARVADWVAAHWRLPDSGIWEVRSKPTHFVQSKAMCWVALDRAARLAEHGHVPDRSERWRREADAIRRFLVEDGWDEERRSYIRAPDLPELDASLLTLSLYAVDDPAGERLQGTVDAIRRELAEGPLVWRYLGEDGVPGEEGAFLACSFWLADAFAKAGRIDEAASLFEDLLGLANDVGLYAEEIARDGTFLGNFPQALVHLALVNAAVEIADAEGQRE
jgi:GH15 family glucan-1,4-alpha-glucosidase